MRLVVVAVGTRLPGWAQQAVDDYAGRFPPELRLDVQPVKAQPRGASAGAAQCALAEGRRIDAAIGRGARRVVLDERGSRRTTAELASRLAAWRLDGRDVALIVGGPDGLAPGVAASADETLRLSDLTLPHALARVVLVESLYRAWTLSTGHPYHRE